MNRFIENLNFKKIVIAYIILLVLVLLSLTVFLGNIYKEKINIVYNYHKLTEIFDKNYNSKNLKNKINNLSNTSIDITDIVILNNNKITYSTNKFYKNDLVSISNSNAYYKDQKNNIYKLDTKEEFILDLFNIKKENKDDYYNSFNINKTKESYTINYLDNNKNNERVIIISNISTIKNNNLYIKVALVTLMFLFMTYWIIVALMIYQNALKLKINAYFWGVVVLFTNIIGVLIYLYYLKRRVVCKKCHANISINDKYCRSCGEKI